MKLTRKQCELLLNVFNAGIANAIKSGFPIGKEYYNDIDEIKEKLYQEIITVKEERFWNLQENKKKD